MEIHSLITDAPLSREDAKVLTGVPRLALLELHHGVGGLEGDALADTVGAIGKFESAPVGSEVVTAGECVAAAAGDLELDRPYQRGVSEVVHMLKKYSRWRQSCWREGSCHPHRLAGRLCAGR
jgi:hypothetical protein